MHALAVLALVVALAAELPPAVTLSDLLARARPSPELLQAEARIAELERALAETAGRLREGPTVALAAGPRRAEGSTEPDLGLDLELPLFSGGGTRERLASLLQASSAAWRAEARALAEARLRSAYLAAWAAERRLALRRDELATAERLLGVARRRVEAGAEPPYQSVLAAADHAVAGMAVAEAEGERARAWAEIAVLAEPGTEGALADPEPDRDGARPVPSDSAGLDATGLRERLAAGALRAAAVARGEVAEALARLGAARDDSRWSLASGVAREADERVARVGVAYRFARRGEREALVRATEAAAHAARREAEVESAGLAARLDAALGRRRALAASPAPVATEPALAALELRLTEGKSSLSEVLLLRRQLVAAREATLDRRLALHQVDAEILLLTAEVTP